MWNDFLSVVFSLYSVTPSVIPSVASSYAIFPSVIISLEPVVSFGCSLRLICDELVTCQFPCINWSVISKSFLVLWCCIYSLILQGFVITTCVGRKKWYVYHTLRPTRTTLVDHEYESCPWIMNESNHFTKFNLKK